MAEINAVGSSSQTAASDAVKKIMGKDDFLKLLITQLKYQDPLEPTDNKDFITQMAQFSSLEQMTNMSSSFEKLAGLQESTLREFSVGQAINLIGRTVSAVLPTETGLINKGSTNVYLKADTSSTILQSLSLNTPVFVIGKAGKMYEVQLANGTTGYVDTTFVTLDQTPRVTGKISIDQTKVYPTADNTLKEIDILSNGTTVTLLSKEGTMYKIAAVDGTTGYVNESAIKIDDNPSSRGVVTGMKIVDNVPNVIVNGRIIPLSYVEEVTTPPSAGQSAGNS